ncbi:lysostaphin resistance A-like protein [Candidatus Eisenbacteria bacterium]|uniref:Lysostaphin resistance A-like protein n=1 Tax=Eiseniibacteriota bacterium TaxID=2212470 RepID=A0ABV6YKL2_UNCEI
MCLRFRPGLLLGGAALGILMGIAIVSILWAFRVARISAYPTRFSGSHIAAILVGHCGWILFKSMLEETVFRGMATREFALRWGWPLATIIGGLYFAAIHFISIVPILTPSLAVSVLVAGIATNGLFVALYRRSRSLWFPIGFHAGWNFALAGILGTTMSGRARSFGLFQTELSGGQFLTGGEFGVEASLLAVILTIVAAIGVIWISRARGVRLLSSRSQCMDE